MKTFKNYLLEEEQANETPSVGDVFELEMARDETLIETTVVEVLEDGIVINADDTVMKMFEDAGYLQEYKTDGPVPSGGSKSPVGSNTVYKKVNTEQSPKDALAEEEMNEGKMKELLGDVNELTHDEFKAKYNMSKDEAREKFDIKDEQELDEMSAMRRLAGMMQDKENIKNTRIPSHDERRIQVDLIDLSDEEFEAKHKMSKAQAREQFDEAHNASAEEEDKFHTELDDLVHKTFGHSSDERGEKMSEPTQDAFQELKDYAETSGGIDKEEFEKAAYLVKAMGKPHLKDKAEGMLDDLIGKMDSDPRDKVIQVLSQHIDLTFLKNLFKEDGDELDEGAMKEVVTDVEDAMGPTKIRYKLKQKGGKFIVSVDSNDEEDAQKALKMHPLYVVGKLRVVPEEIDEAKYQGREVKLGKPMRGDVAKYKVYVKDKKTGNVKKVNFGDKNMEIKRDDPKRRKSFRARHGCGTPKASDRTKARYWSCRMWSSKPVSKII